MAQLRFHVGGMACSLCEAKIRDAVGRIKGVREINVSLAQQEVLIEFEPVEVMPAQLKAALLHLGFTVRDPRKGASFPRIALGGGIGLIALALLALWQWQLDLSGFERWIAEHPFLGGAVYVAAVTLSVVVLPLSSLPFMPFAAHLYGVVPAALLSAAGWWAGSLIAFQFARLGRRFLERVASLEAVDRLEYRIPQDIGFGGIVVLRMILPVDIVSFALGLLKHLRFSTYASASLIGILPFAFVWAYAGGELGAGRFLTFAVVAVALTATVLAVRRLWAGAAR